MAAPLASSHLSPFIDATTHDDHPHIEGRGGERRMRRYGFILFFTGSWFGLFLRYYAQQWGGTIGALGVGELWTLVGLIGSVWSVWSVRHNKAPDRIKHAAHKKVTDARD